MATVNVGRLLGPVGFSRTVAIKRLHPQHAKDPDFVSMFLDEARLAARIRHPNVVPTLDVVALEGELFLVMEYVHGESLSRLMRRLREQGKLTPPGVALAIIAGVLSGLHAAHEATTERGEHLGLVHRDMSPQNVMVCADGTARVLDFGIAKAIGRSQNTREGQLKGKLSYIAPEQLHREDVDRRADIYSTAVTLWEVLTGQRLFKADSEWQVLNQIVSGDPPAPPSSIAADLPPGIDEIVLKGMARDPADRYATAREMGVALEQTMAFASARQVGEWVEEIAGDNLRRRKELVAEIETNSAVMMAPSSMDFSGARASNPELDSTTATTTGTGNILVADNTVNRIGRSAPAAMARSRAPSMPPPAVPPPPDPAVAAALTLALAAPMSPARSPASPLPPSPPSGAIPVDAQSFEDGEAPSRRSPRRRAAWAALAFLLLGVAGVALSMGTASLRTRGADGEVSEGLLEGAEHGDPAVHLKVVPFAVTLTATATAEPATVSVESLPSSTEPFLPAPMPPATSHSSSHVHAPRAVPSAAVPGVTPGGPGAGNAGGAGGGTGAAAASAMECDPPYNIDASGIRHPKPQCL